MNKFKKEYTWLFFATAFLFTAYTFFEINKIEADTTFSSWFCIDVSPIHPNSRNDCMLRNMDISAGDWMSAPVSGSHLLPLATEEVVSSDMWNPVKGYHKLYLCTDGDQDVYPELDEGLGEDGLPGSGNCMEKLFVVGGTCMDDLDNSGSLPGVDESDPSCYLTPGDMSSGYQPLNSETGVTLPPPEINIYSEPDTVYMYDPYNIKWEVKFADSCVASGDWSGARNPTGGILAMPGTGVIKHYTLQCTGSGGTVSRTVDMNLLTLANLLPVDLYRIDNSNSVYDPVTGEYESFDLVYRVKNDGDKSASKFFNSFKLDVYADGSIDYNNIEQELAGVSGNSTSSEKSIRFERKNGSDPIMPYGPAKFYLELDSNDAIFESNETDNVDEFSLMIPPPDPHMVISPQRTLIQKGETVEVNYDTVAAYPMSCEFYGTGISSPYTFSTAVDGKTGSFTVGPFESKANFEMKCKETQFLISDVFFFATTSVEVANSYTEL